MPLQHIKTIDLPNFSTKDNETTFNIPSKRGPQMVKAVDDDNGSTVYVEGVLAGRVIPEWRKTYRAWKVEGSDNLYYTKATAIHACATAFQADRTPTGSPYKKATPPPSKDPHDVVDKITRTQHLAAMVEDMARTLKDALAMLESEVTGDETISTLVRRIPTREVPQMND